MIDNDHLTEKVILVGICLDDQKETYDSLEELEELVRAAGAEPVAVVVQNRESVHPGTYLGKGKVDELKELIWEQEATGIVCDDELSPAQLNNLQDMLDVKVMDRTLVILDIFAQRASTSEGKLQVELAQLKYSSSRLIGMGKSMSRLGGGIGTRGPGEKKLEIDRRLIKTRIAHLNEELEEVRRHRDLTRTQRNKNKIPVAAIVGYTNAGKSTLLNTLTGANVWEMDQVFATLDPTTRMLELPCKQQLLLTDTVGFIRKLPHHLIDAFRSTLEEAKFADIIIHVVDGSNPQAEDQMRIVYKTLDDLGVEGKPIITLINKQDKLRDMMEQAGKNGTAADGKNHTLADGKNGTAADGKNYTVVDGKNGTAAVGESEDDYRIGESLRLIDNTRIHDPRADEVIPVSAREGEGLDRLLEVLQDKLREQKKKITGLIDYKSAGILQQIRENGELLVEEYRAEGIYIEAYVPEAVYNRIELVQI